MQEIKTVIDLFNGPLCDISVKLERADILIQILQDGYLTWSAQAVETDRMKMFDFQNSYEQIQALVWSVRDYTWEARKAMELVESLDIKEIKEWRAKENGEAQG